MEFVEPIRSIDDIERMKKALKEESERDYVLFMIGINTGMMTADILRLKVGDVKGTHIILKNSKQKHKKIVINESLRRTLTPYILNKSDEEYLIKSRQGENRCITRQRVHTILGNAAKKCGLENISAGTMRKTFAYHLYKNTNDINIVQYVLGQRSPMETVKYIGDECDFLESIIEKNTL